MKFKSITIKNYKGIKDLTIRFTDAKRIYTLIGLNESGKSTILEAISNVFSAVPPSQCHTLIPKSEKFSFDGKIQIISQLEIGTEDSDLIIMQTKALGYKNVQIGSSLEIERAYEFEKSTLKETQYLWRFQLDVVKPNTRKFVDLINVNKNNWNTVTDYMEAELLPKVIFYPDFLFDFPEKIYLEPRNNQSLEYGKYRDMVQDILFSIDSKLTIEEDIVGRLKANTYESNEVLDLLLIKMSKNVSSVVFTAWEKLSYKGNKEIVIKHGSELEGSKLNYYLQFKVKERTDQFFISERSLGFKWFFTFLLFTGFRNNRISDKSELLFLLDEPASNLHPTAQKSLLSMMDQILSKSSLIYTTHSHYLINPDWLHGMNIVRNNAISYENELDYDLTTTDITLLPYKNFVAQYPDQREYFQPLLDTLDYQPGLLEKIPSIILCEGKNDFYTFVYINTIYFSDKYHLHFYPSGGANSDEQVVRLYTAWNRRFFILRDSDTGGKNAITKYKKILPIFVTDNNAFSLASISDELDNITVEGIFSAFERKEITRLLDSDAVDYDKSKFNLSIQLLLAERKKIDLSPETLGKFEIIFDFLSAKVKE